MEDYRLFKIADSIVDQGRNRLKRGETVCVITPKAMDVLIVLAKYRNETVSPEVLLDTCWSGKIVGQNAIYQKVHELRKALERCTRGASYIETIPKRGYRLVEKYKS